MQRVPDEVDKSAHWILNEAVRILSDALAFNRFTVSNQYGKKLSMLIKGLRMNTF